MKAQKIIIPVAIVAAAGILAVSSMDTVPVGSTGVVVTMGAVSQNTLTEGLNFKAPFITNIVDMSNKVQKLDVESMATSKDLQAITAGLSINFHLAPERSAQMYQTVGKEYADTLLQPAAQECVKSVMALYSAEQLITNRSAVSVAISDQLTDKLSNYGIGIDEFNIVNFSFSAEFDAAIEAKQVAEQNKIRAQTEKEQRVIEAEANASEKTIAAQAEADATLLRAQAEAEAIKVKAEAEAEANAKLNSSLSKNVLNYNAIEKWNGEYPSVVAGDGSDLLIDIGGNGATAAPAATPAE